MQTAHFTPLASRKKSLSSSNRENMGKSLKHIFMGMIKKKMSKLNKAGTKKNNFFWPRISTETQFLRGGPFAKFIEKDLSTSIGIHKVEPYGVDFE